ncbi:hypothetical protein [Parabacteroides sp. Marseille-P3160]|uniref:hypothetical protein n=1 Tax=Parabacteroides sp. Marseille-P3160 TaxID=1917887 RepID=UPI00111948F2|nr:hypothetical protein [Parabacteroides sp. Marseille-P3160]
MKRISIGTIVLCIVLLLSNCGTSKTQRKNNRKKEKTEKRDKNKSDRKDRNKEDFYQNNGKTTKKSTACLSC